MNKAFSLGGHMPVVVARQLWPGAVDGQQSSVVKSIEWGQGLIGGPGLKTANAMILSFDDGEQAEVHPRHPVHVHELPNI